MPKLLGYLFALFIVAAAIYGWCFNIYKLFQLDGMSGELVVRALGIVIAPLGAIMGFV